MTSNEDIETLVTEYAENEELIVNQIMRLRSASDTLLSFTMDADNSEDYSPLLHGLGDVIADLERADPANAARQLQRALHRRSSYELRLREAKLDVLIRRP